MWRWTGHAEDYFTESLLYHYHIRNRYRRIGVNLSRQKELDVDSAIAEKAIQQIEFVGN